jgi:hypothetical protein
MSSTELEKRLYDDMEEILEIARRGQRFHEDGRDDITVICHAEIEAIAEQWEDDF